jgi:C1A family cysteine protease
MASKRKQFLLAKMNEVRAACPDSAVDPITELTVNGITKKIVAGTQYVANVTIVAGGKSEDKKVTFTKLLPEDVHPHNFVKNHGKENIEDLFSLGAIVPHPCGEATAILTDETPEEIAAKYSYGLIMPDVPQEFVEPTVTAEELARLPASFDWRDEIRSRWGDDAKAAQPLNQGSCGSCWAFGAATAAGYRTIIASNGQYNVVPSTQVGMSCAMPSPDDPCGGGWFNNFYDQMNQHEIPANWAVDYTAQRGPCSVSSDSISVKGATSASIRGVDAMMNELYTNGPFGVYIDAGHSAFGRYSSGVADGASSALNHAVVALGWGTEGGKDYWLVQNSWGAGWGAGGFIKVARGNNALNMETYGAQPNTIDPQSMQCGSNPPCKNGGGFKKDCTCQCADGYSGAQCDSCQKTCSGPQFTGAASITGGSCQCTCNPGFVTPSNLLGYSDCALQMAVGGTAAMATVANGGAVTISFSVAGSATAPSDVIQNVKKGDMYVAVPAGSYPWTAEGGWVTDIRADVCGPKEWPAEPCGDFDASLIFAQDGVYEIFFVKYLGVSEFGTDKGYGSDFMRLPQRVCVGSADCNAAPPPAPPPTPPPPPAPSGGDSCPYANDGECDEPTYCQSGTDSTDCNAAPTPAPTLAPTPAPSAPSGGDSCPYANDGECDEPTYCHSGTDSTDCGGNDSCPYANDGECDEPTYCHSGTDRTDCSGNDSCPYANDGECDEPTYCQSGTDRTDCAGFLIELNSQEDHWGESGVKLAPLKKKRLLKKEESGVKLAPLKKKRLLKKMFR